SMGNNTPMTAGTCLGVPPHAQDCTGYCGLGCVTMIFDAFKLIGDPVSQQFSQVTAYDAVYRTPVIPQLGGQGNIIGFDLLGPFDRWHISPEQLEMILRTGVQGPGQPAAGLNY